MLWFAVGRNKIVQVSQNKGADMFGDCFWCDTVEHCAKQFGPKDNIVSRRITY